MHLHLYDTNLRVLSSPWAFAEGVAMREIGFRD